MLGGLDRIAKAVDRLEREARFQRLVDGETSEADLNHLSDHWSNASPAVLLLYRGLAKSLKRFPHDDELRDVGSDFANAVHAATVEALKRRVHVDLAPGMAPAKFPQKLGEAVARERVEKFILENARLPNRSEVVGLFP